MPAFGFIASYHDLLSLTSILTRPSRLSVLKSPKDFATPHASLSLSFHRTLCTQLSHYTIAEKCVLLSFKHV